MDNVSDLDGIIEAHNRYLGQLEEGLFLNEESTVKILLFFEYVDFFRCISTSFNISCFLLHVSLTIEIIFQVLHNLFCVVFSLITDLLKYYTAFRSEVSHICISVRMIFLFSTCMS